MKLGIEDWKAWLDDVSDEVFNAWQAHYQVEPWGNEELLLAKCASLLSALVAAKVSSNDCYQSVQDNMPPDWYYRKPEKPKATLDEQLTALANFVQQQQ